jgi:hypothetical protein
VRRLAAALLECSRQVGLYTITITTVGAMLCSAVQCSASVKAVRRVEIAKIGPATRWLQSMCGSRSGQQMP